MSGTPNLGLTYSVEGQLQPTVPINYDWNLLDGVLGPAAAFGNNPNTTSGLTYGYYGANLSTGAVAGGTITLAASATNYVQRTAAGVVSSNTTGFTTGDVPLAVVVTGASTITSITDKRQVDAGGLTNPMTTLGDLISGLGSGVPARLPVGTVGQVLSVTSGASGLVPAWETPTAGFINPMTSAGDLIAGGTSGSATRLASGAVGQVLTSTASGLAWENNPAGFTNPMTSAGDMILGGTSGSAGRLASGAVGQVLTSTASGVAWENSPAGFTNPMTAAGDLIVGGSGGSASRLGSGTSGQVLTMVGGTPSWATPASGSTASIVAFLAYQNAGQSLSSGAFTKIKLQAKEYDTANAFDDVTNYRFQPTTAGYYQINARVGFTAPIGNNTLATIYKNGSSYLTLSQPYSATYGIQGSSVVYLNGSTDYIELWCYPADTGGPYTTAATTAPYTTYLSGILAT